MEHHEIKEDLGRWQRIAWVAGAIGAVGTGAGYVLAPEHFFPSYLMAFFYWFSLAGGSLGLLLIHHLVAGHWGFVIQRPLEAAARTIPFAAILFVPVVIGIDKLYAGWIHPSPETAHVVHSKAMYLNVPGFIGRAVVYFVLWTVLAYLLSKWSRLQDSGQDAARQNEKMRTLAGPGLVLFILSITFAAIDWGMSLTPTWFSTMYGPQFMVGQFLSTFSFMALLMSRMEHRKPLQHALGHQQFHDLGNLMFASTILWSYMCIGEYIIIWSGNLYEETEWFLHRAHGGWKPISYALTLGQFLLPFLLLLNKPLKRHGRLLALIAVWILAFRYLAIFWQVAPTFRDHPQVHWVDAATWLGVGGIWLGIFLGQLKRMHLLPEGDARLQAKLAVHAAGHP